MLFEVKKDQFRKKFSLIKNHKANTNIRMQLMEGFLEQLKIFSKFNQNESISPVTSQKILETSQTNFTQNMSIKSRILPFQSRQQLQCKIIEQQRLKMQQYQEIQNYQDDLFQLQKVIKSKKQYQQNLDRKIFQLQHLIQKISKTQADQEYFGKKPLSARLKKLFM